MNAKPRPERNDEDEEIEILEVVGLDEDQPAAPADEIEVSFEDDGTPAAGEPASHKTPDTQERERYLRLYADFENLKKRVERERIEHRLRATESLLARLLPVLDNFERALAAAEKNQSYEALKGGVALTHRQMSSRKRILKAK